jgi:peptidoglycan biosynthesis protein MviN/MurJ (putative lipid II flippase)
LVIYATVSCLLVVAGGLLSGGHGLFIVTLVWISHQVIGLPFSLYALNRHLGISPKRQIAAFMRPLIATALMGGTVLGIGVLVQDQTQIMRLIEVIATGTASYVIFIALIDRDTLRLGRALLGDMRQMRHAA